MSIQQARKKLKALFSVKRERERLKATLHDEPGLKTLLEKNHRLTVAKNSAYQVVHLFAHSLIRSDTLVTPEESIREYDKASKDLLDNHKELLTYLDTRFRQSIDNKNQKVAIHLERLKYLRAYKYLVKEKEAILIYSGHLLIHPYSHEEFEVIQSHYLREYEQLMRLSELPPNLRPTSLLGRARLFFFKPRTHDINSTPPAVSQTESLPTYDEAEGHPEEVPTYSQTLGIAD